MGRGGWMMVVLAGCGPTVAVDGSDNGSTSEANSGDDPDEGTDEAATNATLTASSTAADTGAIDPPIECARPGTCDADCVTWEVEFSSPLDGEAKLGGVAIASDGTIFVTGMVDGDDLALVAYAAGGYAERYETPLGTGDGAPDMPWRIAIASDGKIALAGQRTLPGLAHGWVIVDAFGEVEQRYMEFAAGSWIAALFFAADGSMFVSGGEGSGAAFLHRYSSTGRFIEEWDADDLGLVGGVVLGGVATSASTIALVGMQGEEDDVWLASFDLENGLLWSTTSDGDPSTKQWGADIAVMPDGDLVVAGAQREDDGNALSWAGRFASDGEQRWARTYPGTGCCANAIEHVEVDTEGRVFVLGVRGDQLVAKVQELDCEGEIVWEWNHESPGSGSAFPTGLAWSPQTGLVAVGTHDASEGEIRGFVTRLSP